ncbi:MAG: exodeoxyribonuclease VII small subunit [Deltaproteobacteria bacterium]|nr:MAG: exodeoxyribonuclease VII small subunit [Deltaproteobacteria bacterium]
MTATKKKSEEGEPRFEEALAELEEIVRKLEAGDVPLEESLAAFERGVALVRLLHGRLDAVQEKIEELTRGEQGKAQARPFHDE